MGKEVKLVPLADDIILYIQNPKNLPKNPLELINEFCKVVGHEIDTEKNHLCFCASNEQPEKEENSTTYNSTQNIKIPRNTFH